ncbi:Uncharacterised protein [Salmonella enterica subsp. enterica]|uniref:Uncharacterized protein n=1 Tax=Salmonella enterica I TaxID=59201 RepID=A0A379VNA5_SALET|nr:Uncharacterised protein [Salmonella enterica subsp. enterica]
MDVKKPAELVLYGLSRLTELQYINIWWSWRELNPRPKFLHTIFTLTKTDIYF